MYSYELSMKDPRPFGISQMLAFVLILKKLKLEKKNQMLIN